MDTDTGDVIITVPHAPTEPDAVEAARSLGMKTVTAGIRTLLLEGDVHRSEIDLNRKEARHTTYRRNVAKAVAHAPEGSILIDLHSGDYDPSGTHMAVFLERQDDTDISRSFSRCLTNETVGRFSTRSGDMKNDIMETSRRLPTILVGLNDVEKTPIDTKSKILTDAVIRCRKVMSTQQR